MFVRIFTIITICCYLALGAAIHRLNSSCEVSINVSKNILSVIKLSKKEGITETEKLKTPQISFTEIENREEKIVIPKLKNKIQKKPINYKIHSISAHTLPFDEKIKIEPVRFKSSEFISLMALYKLAPIETLEDKVDEVDSVKTIMASTEEIDPDFFEYENKIIKDETTDVVQINELVVNEEMNSRAKNENNVAVEKSKEYMDEIEISKLLEFDYSKMKQDLNVKTISSNGFVKETKNITHSSNLAIQKKQDVKVEEKKHSKPQMDHDKGNKSLVSNQKDEQQYTNNLTIQIAVTDFKNTEIEKGYEVRPQDNLSESISDYNSGTVLLQEKLANQSMTRTVKILKHGTIPTNTDLILENGDAEIMIPLIKEENFNELMAPFYATGFSGALLVEKDETIKNISIDTSYSKLINLDENLKITNDQNYSFQLFLGLRPGNVMVNILDNQNKNTSKITHIHENELTYENGILENILEEHFWLKEEDLLGSKSVPVSLSSNEIKIFAKDKEAEKININKYKAEFHKSNLGGRKYLELNHLNEPIFVGFKEEKSIYIPSENFMRHILTYASGENLNNRCVIQVNLNKTPIKVDASAEFYNQNLDIKTQILDLDGKFYDSPGPESKKVIIFGEIHALPDTSQDGKVNLKITFEDESVQYLGTYCSPNTYLVEQL